MGSTVTVIPPATLAAERIADHPGQLEIVAARFSFSRCGGDGHERRGALVHILFARSAGERADLSGASFGVRRSRGEQCDGAFAGGGTEVAIIEREDGPTVSFRAGDHGSVGEAEGEVGIAADELADAGEVFVAGFEDEGAFLEVCEEGVENVGAEALFDQVGAAVGEERLTGWLVVGVAPVEQRKQGGGIECDYRSSQLRSSQASLSRAESSASSRRFGGQEVLARLELIRISDRILAAAGSLLPTELPNLDAIHLATARQLGGELARLITCDERLRTAATAAGCPVAAPD